MPDRKSVLSLVYQVMNFRLGIWMEYDDLHHQHVASPTWLFKSPLAGGTYCASPSTGCTACFVCCSLVMNSEQMVNLRELVKDNEKCLKFLWSVELHSLKITLHSS